MGSSTFESPDEFREVMDRVFELSERVRDTIQQTLYENLVKRGSAFV
jgi:tetrahydromethanopterin S-methyltransferase subunit G